MCNTLITTSPLLGFLSCPLSLSSSRRLPWRRSRSDCSTCHSLAQMSWLSGHERSMSDEYNMLFEIKTVYMSNDINGDMTDDLVFIINILKFTSFCLFASDIFCSSKVIDEYSLSTAEPCTVSCLLKFSALSNCVCRLWRYWEECELVWYGRINRSKLCLNL